MLGAPNDTATKNLIVAAVCDRRKRRSQSAATVKNFENDTLPIFNRRDADARREELE
jgi:hypothetical protein